MTEQQGVQKQEVKAPVAIDFRKQVHECGCCGRRYFWSADDISWNYEAEPFLPCGCRWDWLDRVL